MRCRLQTYTIRPRYGQNPRQCSQPLSEPKRGDSSQESASAGVRPPWQPAARDRNVWRGLGLGLAIGWGPWGGQDWPQNFGWGEGEGWVLVSLFQTPVGQRPMRILLVSLIISDFRTIYVLHAFLHGARIHGAKISSCSIRINHLRICVLVSPVRSARIRLLDEPAGTLIGQRRLHLNSRISLKPFEMNWPSRI